MKWRDDARRLSHTLLDGALLLVFAPSCAACQGALDAPSEGSVCGRCWSSVRAMSPPLCRICGDSLPSWRIVSLEEERCARCRRLRSSLDAGRAAGEYEGTLRQIVHAFKYDGRRRLATRLGTLMRAAGADVVHGAGCAVPVPLHPWRRLRRGFNQAADLAAATGLPVVHALWRTRATHAQAGLSAAERKRNVRGAFRLSPFMSKRTIDRTIRGRIVVLVDDVWTTGATLEGCARVLKEAGASEVRALTAARAAIGGQKSEVRGQR